MARGEPLGSAAAGPSRRRRSHSQEETGETSRRRRGRPSTREDLFRTQDPAERQRIGSGYRELQRIADRFKLDGNADAADLARMVGRANKLFNDVKDTELANLDAKVFGATTEAAAQLIRKSKLSSSSYDVDEFLRHVKDVLGLGRIDPDAEGDELEEDGVLRDEAALREYANGEVVGDWAKIGWMAAQMSRRVPGVEFMYGPLAVEHQRRTVNRRARQKEDAPETRPKEIVAETQNKTKDITANNVRIVEKVLKQLDKGDGVNYFRLVVNPHDYGQTVENVFYASFLIHEGRAGVSVQDDGEIIIHHHRRVDPNIDGDVVKNQAVIELTMGDWEDAIRLFNITRASIPNRARPTQAPTADGWYAGTAT